MDMAVFILSALCHQCGQSRRTNVKLWTEDASEASIYLKRICTMKNPAMHSSISRSRKVSGHDVVLYYATMKVQKKRKEHT